MESDPVWIDQVWEADQKLNDPHLTAKDRLQIEKRLRKERQRQLRRKKRKAKRKRRKAKRK